MKSRIIYREFGKDTMYKTWHASKNIIIFYMYSEGGSIVCNEKSYPITKGTLCLVNAGKYHYTMPDIPETYDRSKLFISPENFANICKLFSPGTTFYNFQKKSIIYAQINEAEQELVDRIFLEMEINKNNGEYSDLYQFSCCLKLFAFLNKYSVEITPSTSGFMSKAIEYINNNIYSDINVDQICYAVHMSKSYFCKQFKKHVGTTVMKYILETRIILAKDMLLKDTVSITEISELCGFSSVSYFSQAFKKSTGETPHNFRKKHISP